MCRAASGGEFKEREVYRSAITRRMRGWFQVLHQVFEAYVRSPLNKTSPVVALDSASTTLPEGCKWQLL